MSISTRATAFVEFLPCPLAGVDGRSSPGLTRLLARRCRVEEPQSGLHIQAGRGAVCAFGNHERHRSKDTFRVKAVARELRGASVPTGARNVFAGRFAAFRLMPARRPAHPVFLPEVVARDPLQAVDGPELVRLDG